MLVAEKDTFTPTDRALEAFEAQAIGHAAGCALRSVCEACWPGEEGGS